VKRQEGKILRDQLNNQNIKETHSKFSMKCGEMLQTRENARMSHNNEFKGAKSAFQKEVFFPIRS
jgi:hypothetical protein